MWCLFLSFTESFLTWLSFHLLAHGTFVFIMESISFCLSSLYLSIYLSISQSIYLSISLSIHLSIYSFLSVFCLSLSIFYLGLSIRFRGRINCSNLNTYPLKSPRLILPAGSKISVSFKFKYSKMKTWYRFVMVNSLLPLTSWRSQCSVDLMDWYIVKVWA